MFTYNLLRNTPEDEVAREKRKRQDALKEATKELKAQGFRVIKKPRHNQFVLLDLKCGKIYEGRGYTLELNDLIDLKLYYGYKYRFFRKERVQIIAKKLQNNPRLCGEYSELTCADSNSEGYSVWQGEIRKPDKRLEKRAKTFNLLVFCYPYRIFLANSLYNAYIIFDRKTGELLGKEGWHTWTKEDVEQYLDKLESGEIVR